MNEKQTNKQTKKINNNTKIFLKVLTFSVNSCLPKIDVQRNV